MIPFQIVFKEVCSSTNDEIKTKPINTVLYAGRQTNGKGRNGRVWCDGFGNLMASIVLNKSENPHHFSFITSLAVAQSISFLSPRIKWPNDVLVDGKKIAGILLEVFDDKLIIGFGVNIQSHPTKDLLYQATDLKEYGKAVDAEKLLQDILQNFNFMLKLYQKEGFKQIRLDWLQYCMGIGKNIFVNLPHQTIEGVFENIDDEGSLILKDKKGKIHQITAGDIFMI